jgi:hypothetical protein
MRYPGPLAALSHHPIGPRTFGHNGEVEAVFLGGQGVAALKRTKPALCKSEGRPGGAMTEQQIETITQRTTKRWKRIPDGIRVRLRENAQEGVIDGLTELVIGPSRNPDGRTQYRINLGDPERMLVAEDALLILIDKDGLVFMLREKLDYRRLVTEQLRSGFSADRFVPSA